MRINNILQKNQVLNVLKDFAWNILAVLIITCTLQLYLYPYLAKWLDSEQYGSVLTIMGVANIIIVSLGGGLNNVRLLQTENYYDKKNGDFNYLLGIFGCAGIVVFTIIILFFFDIKIIDGILLIFYTIIGIVRNYWSVEYRLKINYKSNLKLNLIICIGYAIGYLIAKTISIWSLCFLVGEVFGLVYLFFTTNLYKESYKKTERWKETYIKYIVLIITALMANVIIYLDRFLLYPLLGGTQVSIFTVSSFVGKSIGLVITPIAGVLLSYYAQKDFKMTVKKYWIINGLILGCSIFGGAISIIFAPWITGILYPTLIKDAMSYIIIANVAALVGVLSNILSPSVMKYANIKWQLIIQLLYAIFYFGLGIIFLELEGMMGFCVAVTFVNVLRVILLLIIGFKGVLNIQVKGE